MIRLVFLVGIYLGLPSAAAAQTCTEARAEFVSLMPAMTPNRRESFSSDYMRLMADRISRGAEQFEQLFSFWKISHQWSRNKEIDPDEARFVLAIDVLMDCYDEDDPYLEDERYKARRASIAELGMRQEVRSLAESVLE